MSWVLLIAQTPDIIGSPYIQWGFAGFAFVLVGVIVWLIRQLLEHLKMSNEVLSKNMEVIKDNTHAIKDLNSKTGDQLRLLRSMHDRLLARPCLLPREGET